MPTEKFTFKNSGNQKYNDTVYDRLFDLHNFNYQFNLFPKTNFWRFGIRFSKSASVAFAHPSGRYYDNENYPNIELDIGDMPTDNNWILPGKVDIACNSLPGYRNGTVFKRWENYIPLSGVYVSLQFNVNSNDLKLAVRTTPDNFHEQTIKIIGFRFFKIFAWADLIDYDMDCEIEIKHPLVNEDLVPSSTEYTKSNFWLLKLNNESANLASLSNGARINLTDAMVTKNNLAENYFQVLNINDRVIGYDFTNSNAVVCVFDVVASLQEGDLSTRTELIVSEVFKPYIASELFINNIPFASELDTNSPTKLIRLSLSQFNAIINATLPEMKRLSFLPSYLPEGNHEKTEDQLEFANDIESIASVIALKSVNPPLAIGLFGNWGSGKSFFMEKLSEQISIYTKNKDREYVEHVVHVKFNSWHYSDSNLWASLITQIFESLNIFAQKKPHGAEVIAALYKRLEITNSQITVTERKIEESVKQIKELKEDESKIQADIEKKKTELSWWNNGELTRIVWNSPAIQEQVEGLRKEFVNEQLIKNVGEIKLRVTELNTFYGRLIKSIAILRKNSKGKWRIVWGLLAFSFLITYLVLGPLKNFATEVIRNFSVVISFIAFGASYFKNLEPYFRKINIYFKQLKSLKDTIDSAVSRSQINEESEKRKIRNQIQVLEIEREKLTAKIVVQQSEKEKLEKEIVEIGSGKLIANFILQKSTETNYSNELGIISWIRKDFSKLNDLFEQQKKVNENKKIEEIKELQIDRIILYVDDLDRCNEEVVLNVLEAIHLLLAFPLFVVIVGVDARWLNYAIDKKLHYLLGSDDGKEKENGRIVHPTTSFDYLEKIFQIPFSIKPINKTGRHALINYLMRNEMEKITNLDPKNTSVAKNAELRLNETNSTTRDLEKISTSQSLAKTTNIEQPNVNSNEKAMPSSDSGETKIILSFKKEELEFIQKLSPLFGKTPRHINRYINIYRILRSHDSLIIINQEDPKEYYPVLFLLAVIVGYNENAPEFIKAMTKYDSDKSLKEFLDFIESKDPTNPNANKKMLLEIKSILDRPFITRTLEDIKTNIELVSRFSFRPIFID